VKLKTEAELKKALYRLALVPLIRPTLIAGFCS
jgi:hypothetical protein